MIKPLEGGYTYEEEEYPEFGITICGVYKRGQEFYWEKPESEKDQIEAVWKAKDAVDRIINSKNI